MENISTAGDELCLFLLGRIYFRHSTVLTKYNMWSTIDIALRVPDQELISCSSIKLVYMGSNAYGILRSKNVAVVPPGVPLTIPSGNSVITHQLNPARGITNRRRVGRFRSVIPSSCGNRLITSMPGYSSMGLPPRQYHQTRRRTIPLCPTPYVLSPPSRSMGTRTRRRTTNIPSQYRNLYRGSPARPLNQVSTIPGYSFSNKSWTTTGWQPAQEERLSPEVASLLQNLQGSSKDTNTVTSLKSSTTATTSTPRPVDIPLIVIDEESPVLTEEPQNSNANLGKNPYDMENINCYSGLLTVETDTGSTEARASIPVSPDESSNSSKDSTLELLQDFGNVLTGRTIVDKEIPSEPVLYPAARPLTGPSEQEKIKAPIYKTQVPTIFNDETCQHLPGTENEIEHDSKNIVKQETSATPVIKSEQGPEVKLEAENVQVATTDWVPKAEMDSTTTTHEGVKDENPENPIGSFTNPEDTIKHESEEEYVDRDMDFTVIDAGLIQSLIACNKPRPKPKPTPKKRKQSTETKKRTKKSVKCTPLDRTINATSKQLFAQLRSIKLEVKRETAEHSSSPPMNNNTTESREKHSTLSSLDNLDIPDLVYHPETSEQSVPIKSSTESHEHKPDSTITRNDILKERSRTDSVEPFQLLNAPIDHDEVKTSTDNVTPCERSSTDASETDSDHDPNWELKPIVSPKTERKTGTNWTNEKDQDYSPLQSDTETYSQDTNDDDKLSEKSKTSDKTSIIGSDKEMDVTSNSSDNEANIKQVHKEHSGTETDNGNTTHSDSNQLQVQSLKSKGRKRKRIHSSDDNSNAETESSNRQKKRKVNTDHKTASTTTSQNDISVTKRRKFKCPKCSEIKYSVHELNAHYRERHSPVKCGSCTKTFATPSGLHKHKYVHQVKLFKCGDCDKSYHFLSQLQSHELTHLDTSKFVCDHKNCGKTFKRKNEYERHVVVHNNIKHKCEHPGCNYFNYDIRNLVAHKKIHNPGVKPYNCEHCGKSFLHYTQRTRHYNGECTEMSTSKS